MPMGDLALAGAPMLGSYRSVRGGHRLNAHVLQALFADTDAWTMVRAPWVREAVPVDVSVAWPPSTTPPTAPERAHSADPDRLGFARRTASQHHNSAAKWADRTRG